MGGAMPKGVDLVTSATPLEVLSTGGEGLPSLLDMFLGVRGGAVGETCVIALLIGFAYLVIRRVIRWYVPAIFVGSVFVLYFVTTGSAVTALYEIMAGGLFLGAIFMATDYQTSPINNKGKAFFALGCGILTFVIREYCAYPEGVSLSILVMNILAPMIEKWTAATPLGLGGPKKCKNKGSFLRSALTLIVLFLVFALLLTGLNVWAGPRIERSEASQAPRPAYGYFPRRTGLYSSLQQRRLRRQRAYRRSGDRAEHLCQISGPPAVRSLHHARPATHDPIDISMAVDTEGKIVGTQVLSYPDTKDMGVDTYPQTYIGQDSTRGRKSRCGRDVFLQGVP